MFKEGPVMDDYSSVKTFYVFVWWQYLNAWELLNPAGNGSDGSDMCLKTGFFSALRLECELYMELETWWYTGTK